jgi:hypothetical protein
MKMNQHSPDATLIAQHRPPAQLAEGYTPDQSTSGQAAANSARIDERAEFEKEFPIPEGLEYCRQRGTYIRTPGASTSDNFAREHYAFRAGYTTWMRRAWKQPVLGGQAIGHVTAETDKQDSPA